MRRMAIPAGAMLAAAGLMAALAVPIVIGAQTDAGKARLKTPAALKEKAPDKYKAKFDTSAGVIVIEVTRAWAPLGADRFYNLVKNGFYDDVRFFRVLSGFMAQFGMNGDPTIQGPWSKTNFPDDPVKESNKRGYVTFAKTSAPNSRSTQVFINFGDNSQLDKDGFAPFGRVTEGMNVVDSIARAPAIGEKPVDPVIVNRTYIVKRTELK